MGNYCADHIEEVIAEIEERVSRDEGNRGTAPLVKPGSLFKACLALQSKQRIAILTGFPCLIDLEVP